MKKRFGTILPSECKCPKKTTAQKREAKVIKAIGSAFKTHPSPGETVFKMPGTKKLAAAARKLSDSDLATLMTMAMGWAGVDSICELWRNRKA